MHLQKWVVPCGSAVISIYYLPFLSSTLPFALHYRAAAAAARGCLKARPLFMECNHQCENICHICGCSYATNVLICRYRLCLLSFTLYDIYRELSYSQQTQLCNYNYDSFRCITWIPDSARFSYCTYIPHLILRISLIFFSISRW